MTSSSLLFFCEHGEPATFERMNLFGCILGDRISIPVTPYEFRAELCGIRYETSPIALPGDIQLRCAFRSYDGLALTFPPEAVRRERVIGQAAHARCIILILPVLLPLPSLGVLEARISMGGLTDSVGIWDVVSGVGAATGRGMPQAPSGVIASKSPFDVEAMFRSVLDDVAIGDCYFDVSLLPQLAGMPNSHARVRILTGERRRQALTGYKSHLLSRLPNTEVRFSPEFHDRFVIVDRTEVFHFGHSIKDLNTGRISRYSKVLGVDEQVELIRCFESVWVQASAW